MTSEDKFWLAVWGIFFLGLVLLSLPWTYYLRFNVTKFVEGGYCQASVLGQDDMAWTKCEVKKP